MISDETGLELEKEVDVIMSKIIDNSNDEMISRFADYRNYMNYDILVTNQDLKKAKLSKQTGYNSGAEVQIPYILILVSALLITFNNRINSTRLIFIDEPFVKMDPVNIKLMMEFFKQHNLQVIFCAPDKIDPIGADCDVIIPMFRSGKGDSLRFEVGIVQLKKEKKFDVQGKVA